MRALLALLTSDRLAALILIAVFGAYGLYGGEIPRALDADVVGPGFFPAIVSVAGAVLALVLLLRGKPEEKRKIVEIDYGALAPIGALLAYGLVLEAVGFPIATFVFLSYTFKYLGCPGWVRSLLTAALATAGAMLLFEYGLDLHLPSGMLAHR